MESFSYQHQHPFLPDPVYFPNTSIEMPIIPHQAGEITSLSSFFPCYYSSPETTPEISTSSSLDTSREFPAPLLTMQKKRKNLKEPPLAPVQPMITKERKKSKKQEKPSCGLKQTEENKPKADGLVTTEDPPAGYIHVRARRGQATDSHSLAERVRRERISERMKMLQGLVPGCDKVTGKALVLDEIINYVQSLQNQVEFLSMRLASCSPMIYDLDDDHDDCMNQREKMGRIPQSVPSVIIQSSSHIQPTVVESATNGYPMMDSNQGTELYAHPFNDNMGFQVPVGEQRREFLDRVEFNNMCYFPLGK